MARGEAASDCIFYQDVKDKFRLEPKINKFQCLVMNGEKQCQVKISGPNGPRAGSRMYNL